MLGVANTVISIIDVQGKLATLMHEKEKLYKNLQILVQGAQVLELPVLWLEQYPEGLGPTIPEISELLSYQEPLAKTCFSACGQSEFVRQLDNSGRKQVLIAGIETHICVYQTVRDLMDRGYYVEVIEDAVSSRTPANKRVGLEKMAACGAAITTVEMALFELLRKAESPQFKEIARLVK